MIDRYKNLAHYNFILVFSYTKIVSENFFKN